MGNRRSNNRKRMSPQKRKRDGKLRLITFGFIVCLAGLLANVFYIKSAFGDEYEREAIIQQITQNSVDKSIMPNRGAILDRYENTQALAISTTVYNVIFDVKVFLEQKEKIADDKKQDFQDKLYNAVSKTLNISAETMDGYLVDKAASNYVKIASKISGKEKEELEKEEISSIWFEEDTLRRYPGGNLAAALIGFTRGDDSNWGLEATYNEALSGTYGRMVRLYDKDNNAITQKIDPVKGQTLITTLDLIIQQEAQRLTEKYGKDSQAENASLVVANPKTMEILAMAQYPSYDLNDPFDIEKINDDDLRVSLELMDNDTRLNKLYSLWQNFSISYTYEPGSIYKPLVVAAALEEGIVTPNSTFYCGGGTTILDTYVPCNNGRGHGHQDLTGVLAHSCNVGMIKINSDLGRERYYSYQQGFGVGEHTGIDLPGEGGTSSFIYYTLSQLNPVELGVCGMGQGFSVTGIQMLTAFSSVINGGNMMRPYIVSQILDDNKNVVLENQPTVMRKVLSEETSAWIRNAMVATITPEGTGRKAVIDGYLVGGKTGTAQQGDKDDDEDELILSFIEYFPADNPEYIILSTINRAKNYVEGSSQTIPMATDLANFIIQHKRIPPNDASPDTQFGIYTDTEVLEDYRGRSISETINTLNYLEFVYDVSGSGATVKDQIPAPGVRAAKGSKIFIVLEESGDTEDLSFVPNVVGMTKEQAQEVIINANLLPVFKVMEDSLQNTSEEENEEEPEIAVPQTVISQLISEIKLEKGTEIVIYIK